MLQFAVLYMILEVTKVKGYDGALVMSVETALEECSDLLNVMGNWVGERLHDTRRRAEDDFTEQLEGKLDTCDAIFEVADTFRAVSEGFVRPAYGTISVHISESFFLKAILSHVSKKIGEVLYIASRDGDLATDFHSACDDQGPTIVICETTTGFIFGGYAAKSWESINDYVVADTSFLFGVRPTLKKYDAVESEGSIEAILYDRPDYGPTFGRGHDLHIPSGALGNIISSTNGRNYMERNSRVLNDGQFSFYLTDYVVLQAIDL